MLKFIEYGDYVTTLNQFDDKEKRVKTLTFQVTNSCNLKCSYCY